MVEMISVLAVAVLLWLILKPFILLYIEKENEKHDKSNR
jgi:flagellar biosynthesis/type III secretory pathway M-ring protein FliF/YscJ